MENGQQKKSKSITEVTKSMRDNFDFANQEFNKMMHNSRLELDYLKNKYGETSTAYCRQFEKYVLLTKYQSIIAMYVRNLEGNVFLSSCTIKVISGIVGISEKEIREIATDSITLRN